MWHRHLADELNTSLAGSQCHDFGRFHIAVLGIREGRACRVSSSVLPELVGRDELVPPLIDRALRARNLGNAGAGRG